MRFVSAVGIVVLLGGVPEVAFAQETIALAVEGWRQETRDGVTYYRCASQICAAGSVVSYKQQPHRSALPFEDFEKHHRGLAEFNKGKGRIKDVRITAMKQRTVDGVRVYEVAREVERDDSTTYSIEARLIGPDQSYSLVSDSPKAEWTVNNYEGFLRRMTDIAGIQKPR